MKTIEIKNRFTGDVIYSTEVDDDDASPIRTAVTKATVAGAYLAGADLADAYLAGAYLAGAYLAGAYLAGAYLAGADLADAKNVPADTAATSPEQPYERKALPRAQRLAARAKEYRERNPDVPVVEQLDRRILQIVDGGEGVLRMDSWHGVEPTDGTACGTTHCRAGWAIHLAGAAGYELEKRHGPERAGAMIYRASTGRVPHFFASNAAALADIKRCAVEQGDEQQ